MAAPAFRDVTLLYSRKDQGWCNYVLKSFRSDQLKLRLELLAVDDTDYENPPEIEVAVRESHVLVMFTTTNLQDYMEEKKAWFLPMLAKSDPEVSVIYTVLLDVSGDSMQSFCLEHGYSYEATNCRELDVSGSNITGIIVDILNLVEIYKDRKEKRDGRLNRRSSQDSRFVQIVPESIPKAGEKMAVLFQQEITSNVSVNLNYGKDDVECEVVNPYCAVFTVPEISSSESRVTLQINKDGARHSRRKLPNAQQVSSQFSSIDLLCQTYGTSTKEELDKQLANRFANSLCSDPISMRILDVAPEESRPGQRSPHQYPSMLHWAAAHGLKDFTSALLSAPGATLASQINNVDNNDPIDLAKKNGYNELSKFIYDFLEAQELANTCDLYVQFSGSIAHTEQDQTYEDMDFPTADNPSGQSSGPNPPPLPPPRTSRNNSLSTEELPSPKNFFFDKTIEPILPIGSLGSRSQTELIEIQEEVKKGNFSIIEAEMLFRSWKDRYMTGNAVSFRDRQRGLDDFKRENQRAMEALKKLGQGNKKIKEDPNEATPSAIEISDPILKRQNNLSSKRMTGAGRGDSTNSNMSCQSMDSGRESSVSLTSQASFSSEDFEYTDPDQMPLRSPKEPGRRESAKRNRISIKDMYLSLVEESENEGRELSSPPPPVPPRPPSRTPSLTKNVKTRTMSQTTPPAVPQSKPQVFVRRGSSTSTLPTPSPRFNSTK
ncbi:hypothetical protein EGW08_017388 [Elysia chlorotica]|uniref:DBB domain-containing protein n=1 Tax=Elysia chlorotica TaxID=188477 RepID=A0A433SZU7_ELYCH|nr:hypothetical protein EGW08_017388 [Elysia chlorotica]